MGLFDGKAVPGKTQSELKARSTAAGVDWNAKKFPWVHVESMSDACSVILSSKYVSDTYGRTGRPLQTVTSVSVKKQGELGTTRACTVEFLAYNDDQLNQMQKCFFIPGMTVRVQWGWSIDVSGAKPPEPIGGGLSDNTAICQMQNKAGSSAIYDGLQGLITNFSYKLNDENIWECSFELVAASEGVGDTKVAVQADCPNCERTFETEGEDPREIVEKSCGELYTFLYDVHMDAADGGTSFGSYISKLKEGMGDAWANGATIAISAHNYEGEDRDYKGGSTQSAFSFGNWDTTEGYISWGALEAAINRYSQPTSSGKYMLGRIASGKLMVKSHPKLTSGDPRICVIGGAMFDSGDGSSFTPSAPRIHSSNELDFSGIMLNCIFLMQELKSVSDGDNKISTFLNAVLKKINNVCGGFWEDMLEIVSSTENCADKTEVPTISLIDIRNFKPAATFQLPSTPTNSVLRDFTLEMKITAAMKSQALYSNGAKQNAKGSKCATIGFVPFGLSNAGGIGVKGKPKATTPPPCDCSSTKQAGKSKPQSFDQIFEEMWDAVDSGTTGAAINAVAAKVNAGDAKDTCKGLPMPFEFGFTVDGIGGFAWGQLISSDRIPASVRSAWDFRITAVEHNITSQDWTTKVNTVAIYK